MYSTAAKENHLDKIEYTHITATNEVEIEVLNMPNGL
jgi:hypothetical protein